MLPAPAAVILIRVQLAPPTLLLKVMVPLPVLTKVKLLSILHKPTVIFSEAESCKFTTLPLAVQLKPGPAPLLFTSNGTVAPVLPPILALVAVKAIVGLLIAVLAGVLASI